MGKVFVRSYSVTLQGYAALPLRDRLIAQDRFSSAMENLLGGVHGVVTVFQATGMGSDAVPPGLARDTALQRWADAARMARLLGLRGLANLQSAYFEVSVPDQASATDGTAAEPTRERPVQVAGTHTA